MVRHFEHQVHLRLASARLGALYSLAPAALGHPASNPALGIERTSSIRFILARPEGHARCDDYRDPATLKTTLTTAETGPEQAVRTLVAQIPLEQLPKRHRGANF